MAISVETKFKNILEKIVKKVIIPTQGKVESDFQQAFEDVLKSASIPYKPKVTTQPLFKDEDGNEPDDWEIDVVLNIKDFYIPIELKFRHGKQEFNNYDNLFDRDVDRIEHLVAAYNDVPIGCAIFVSDIPKLMNMINAIFPNEWFELKNGYKACIIVRSAIKSGDETFAFDYYLSGL